jgi:hypothetical protein
VARGPEGEPGTVWVVLVNYFGEQGGDVAGVFSSEGAADAAAADLKRRHRLTDAWSAPHRLNGVDDCWGDEPAPAPPEGNAP